MRAGGVHVDTAAPKKGNASVKNSSRGAEHFLTCSFRGTVHSKWWSSCPVTVAALQVHNFITPPPSLPKKKDLNPMGHHANKKCVNIAVHHRNMWSVAGVRLTSLSQLML